MTWPFKIDDQTYLFLNKGNVSGKRFSVLALLLFFTVGFSIQSEAFPSPANMLSGPPDVTNPATALSVVTNNAVADGVTTNSVKAHIADATGTLVANQAVVFAISGGTGSFVGSSTVNTDASGNAVITLNSTVSGNVTITATVNGTALINGSPATVTFVAGPPSVTNPATKLVVTANNAVADGVAKNSITAHIVDANGNPIANQDVAFSTSGINPVIKTDINGDAVLDLSSTIVGTVTVTAKVNGLIITFGSPAIVFFVAGPVAVSNPSTALSVVTNNAIANGLATNSVKAHVADANGNPVAGQSVVFSIASGSGAFVGGISTVTTDINGDAVISLNSTVAGNVGVTATVNSLSIVNGSPAVVTFVAGAPSVLSPTTALSVVTNNAIANGSATNSVKAHITDINGNPTSNQTVVFSILSGTGTIVGSTTVTTDVNGDAVITLNSTLAGNVSLTAKVNGVSILNGSPATVTFVAGAPSVGNAATSLSVVTNNAVADGTATNSVRAHIVDANGNVVAGQDVVFSIASGTGTFVGSTTVTTDASGNAVITLNSIVAGNVGVTATVNGAAIVTGSPAIVTFVAGPASVANAATALSVVTNNAIANGVATNSVQAHIVDANGNVVAGQVVVFSIASGTGTFVGSTSVTTDAGGNAVISLNSLKAGNVNITATVNGSAIVTGSPAIVTFVAGPPSVSNPGTALSVVANNAVANGIATNSVQAHIVDANGNVVAGQAVIFSIASGSGTFVGSTTVTTDASGNAVISLNSLVTGNVGITATVNGSALLNGSPAVVTFIADVPAVSNPATALSVVTNNAKANGSATNSVKAHIVDANGNPTPNQTIIFTISGGTGTFVGSTTLTTDANGDAVIALNSVVAGNVSITATVNGTPITNGSPAVVTFVADVPAVSNPATALSVVANNAIANGVATNSVQAHIVDAHGNIVANQAVVFAIASGSGTFVGSTTVTTDASGNAVITLNSLVAGNVNITATVNGAAIVNGSPAVVTFVASSPSVANPATALSVVTNNAVADGVATNSVKAHVVDANGNPTANQTIVFNISSGTGTLVGSSTVTTDASGNAIITLNSTLAGNVGITATVNGTSIINGSPAIVTFVASSPSVSNPSTALSVVTNNAAASGAATNSVRAHVVDANGNPTPNQSVTFAIFSGTGTFVGSTTLTTDASGNAIISLTSTVAGNVSITAKVNGISIINGSPAVVTFVASSASVTSPTTTLSVVTNNAVANGVSTNSVQAHITDANGNVVAGQVVVFAISSGTGTFVGTNSITTDASGNAVITLNSTVAGNVGITAKVNGLSIINGSPAVVTFIADVPAVGNPATALSVVTNNAAANGSAVNSVKAHIVDANGNPTPNQTIVFSILSGTGSFVGSTTVTTDASGNAVITLNSTLAGNVSITATVNGTPIINGSPAVVTFVASNPAVGNPATALSVVTNNAAADGVSTNSVKAHIVDANGNVVAGQPVIFSIQSGTGTFVGSTTVTTDASGNAIIALNSVLAGNVAVTAKVNGASITNGSPAIVTFVASTASVGNPATALSVVTNNAVADGAATNSVKAHIVDANGNVVANQTVIFSISSGTGTFVGTASVATDASGNAIIALTSTVAGNVSITAIINGTSIINGSPASVTFVAGGASAGNPATALSIVTNNAVADGIATNSVRAHIVDASGNVVANQFVVFTIASGTAGFVGIDSVKTDASGNAIISLTSTVAGNAGITATINGISITSGSPAIVTFVAGSGSVGNPGTALSVVTNNAAANDTATNSVRAHIVDVNGNPVANQYVVFTIASGTASFVGVDSVKTDASGNAVISLVSTQIGSVGITATINGAAIVNGSPVTVKFQASAPDVSDTTTRLTVVANNAIANGTAVNSVNAHITDKHGNPAAGQTIIFTIASGTASFVGTDTLTTDTNGNALISLNSTLAGSVNITATVNGTNIPNGSPAIVKFVAGPASVSDTASRLSVVTNNAVADGIATNSVKAHIADAQGNPVANQPVIFTIASGSGNFVGIDTVSTDASGNAVILINSTVAGSVNITATVNGSNIVNGSPAVVTFIAGAASVTDSLTKLLVLTNHATSNGTSTNSVEAHIADAYGNAVANQAVIFSLDSGSASFVGSDTVMTDAQGDAIVKLTSTIAGDAYLSATVNSLKITNGSPAKITFVNAPDPSNDSTYIIVIQNNAMADGVAQNAVRAHIADQNGTPLPDRYVTFTVASGTAGFTGADSVMTDSSGNAVIFLTSSKPGAVTVTATVDGLQIIHGSPAKLRFVAEDIYVPRVFTPNGDGVNDILRPILVGIPVFHYFSIYNRWGNLIFTTQDPNAGWDGTFKGVIQPVETYLWIAEGINSEGKTVVQKGMVSLVR